jgi:sugar lactone lactonase YvrE
MKRVGIVGTLLLVTVAVALAQQPPPKPRAEELKNPVNLVAGTDARVYVAAGAETGKDGADAVLVVQDGKAVPFATGFHALQGMAVYLESLFVADRDGVWRLDRKGNATLFVPVKAFPEPVHRLMGLTADPESGILYVADGGVGAGGHGAVYRISPQGQISFVTDRKHWPDQHTPTGLVLDGASHLLVLDSGGELLRVKLADGSTERVAQDLGSGGWLAWDRHGRLFLTDTRGGRLLVIPRPGEKPVRVSGGQGAAGRRHEVRLAPGRT